MKDSTRRSLRTGYQALVALLVIVPVLLSGLALGPQITAIVGALALATKLVNALEDARIIPPWLKAGTTAPEPALEATEDLSGS